MLHNTKTAIKGMSLPELQSWCKSVGETSIRGIQLYEWMYKKGVSNPEKMSNISQKFRDYLVSNTITSTIQLELKTKSNLMTAELMLN